MGFVSQPIPHLIYAQYPISLARGNFSIPLSFLKTSGKLSLKLEQEIFTSLARSEYFS
jgi:hypothetical protein